MYIEKVYYVDLPSRKATKPRERYIQYYQDLHNRYRVPLDLQTFYQGGQFKFHELGYHVLDKCYEDGYLCKLDLMVVCYWSHECDPDFASCGPHFAYYYGFTCDMFDVLDQGSICTFTALSLIQQYLHASENKIALCLALDQTTNPRANLHIPAPTVNVAAALIARFANAKKDKIKIITIKIWTEQQIYNNKFDIIKLILQELEKNKINFEKYILYCKKNTAIFKSINLYQYQYKEFMRNMIIKEMPMQLSCSGIMQMLLNIYARKIALQQYCLILEEDVESQTTALMILKII